MIRSGNEILAERRARNGEALAVFGKSSEPLSAEDASRTSREGGDRELFTIGYERRSGAQLVEALLQFGIEVLVDVRQVPISRKPDFRASALQEFCVESGIDYQSWTELGSTKAQRDRLRESGDIKTFRRVFRQFVKRGRCEVVSKLARFSRTRRVALMCYERLHEDCHRSVIADLVAEENGATVIAVS